MTIFITESPNEMVEGESSLFTGVCSLVMLKLGI